MAWQSADITANSIRIHYHRSGDDKPPLILAHGMTDSGLCWSRVARALEGEYDIIMPDARGHGSSEAPEHGYDYEDMAGDLAGLITALSLEQPAVIGHSMGAMTAMYLAARHPEAVRRIVLEDPPLRSERITLEQAEMERRRVRWGREMAENWVRDRSALRERVRHEHPSWVEEEVEPWVDAKVAVSPQFLRAALPDRDWRETLGGVRCPLLLVTADPELGAIVSPQTAEEVSHFHPQATVVRLRGAGHSIHRERFEEYMEKVRGFLAQV